MQFSLIICTYKRAESLLRLLESVRKQEVKPEEILIIDGSPDEYTLRTIERKNYPSVRYFRVEEKDRGLTRQRNFGLRQLSVDSEVVCFLDDDVVLERDYFRNLLETYHQKPDAIGVGGYISDQVKWERKRNPPSYAEYKIDGWTRKLGSRNLLRKRFGLLSDKAPGIMPDFSNGFSIGFLPPSGKIYPVEYFMGGVASYHRKVFKKIDFSPYFEGYGLYEDMDFCLRASTLGQLYVNTAARLHHLHEDSGRPGKFKYGKMVVRNGWYVWRVKHPRPKPKAKLKWHGTFLVLTLVRVGNIFTTTRRKEALTESLGRMVGWWTLIFKKPLKKND